MKLWEPEPPGTLWATPSLLRGSFTFYNSDTLKIQNKCYISKPQSDRSSDPTRPLQPGHNKTFIKQSMFSSTLMTSYEKCTEQLIFVLFCTRKFTYTDIRYKYPGAFYI